MNTNATVFIRKDGRRVEVGRFLFSDMAEVAAAAITQRYGWPTTVVFNGEDGMPDAHFKWEQVTEKKVVKS